ncbi:MAG: pyridoxal 5'-phosphate synthase glutaminase subunit PdxT [Actinobacteria bacterium]|uniref:glutaminase n=1 Tax=freshwater metagenome TaxID=449393 RepID=A0A6J7SNW7_9ZZZZ|nr:pyridoxal 5'-phosphate synthase glutaminase subunit PdxT [Actinomycetota bacterium]
MKVGVLALQGDVREHFSALIACGVYPTTIRRRAELDAVEALVIPGGESTTISQLAKSFDLFQPIRDRISHGMPVYGSCAGMILLADHILDAKADQESFGGLDITVRRNAFGRQVDSFESDIAFADGTPTPVSAVFIRAPWIEKIGSGIEILAEVDAHPVAVRSKSILATSFHPELTGDHRIHRYFIEEVARGALQQVQ